jgi:hypothetical protein
MKLAIVFWIWTAALGAGAQETSPVVDAEADRLLREMSDKLSKAPRFALEAEETFDEIPDVGPRRELTSVRSIVMERPNRAVADVVGETRNRTVWFDRGRLTVLDKEQNAYASLEAPPTVDAVLDWVAEEYGIEVPLSDLLFSDVYSILMEGVIRGEYLGFQKAAGASCHHLAFEQETIDWQIWIDAETRLPRKLAIAYKTEPGEPRYEVVITKWNLSPTFPEGLFDFEPPEGAEKIELARVLGEKEEVQ